MCVHVCSSVCLSVKVFDFWHYVTLNDNAVLSYALATLSIIALARTGGLVIPENGGDLECWL